MKRSEQALKRYAKQLVRLSLEGQRVSSERVDAVLKAIVDRSDPQLKRILKYYLLLIKHEIKRTRAFVDCVGDVPLPVAEALQKKLETNYQRPLELEVRQAPELIAGMRVTVADDVYESSVIFRLKQLASSL